MPKRLYLLIAFMILIGAPLIARLASNAAPTAESIAPSSNEALPARPVVKQISTPPGPPPVIPPPEAMAQPFEDSVNAVAEAAPALDPQGIEPAPVGDVESVATQLTNAPPPS